MYGVPYICRYFRERFSSESRSFFKPKFAQNGGKSTFLIFVRHGFLCPKIFLGCQIWPQWVQIHPFFARMVKSVDLV